MIGADDGDKGHSPGCAGGTDGYGMPMRNTVLLAASLGLSGCAVVPRPAPPPPPPVAIAVPAPPPPAPVAPDWRDRPFTVGSWTLVREPGGPAARFGHAGAEADFLMRCTSASRRIDFLRAGSLPAGSVFAMTLASTEIAKNYPAANGSGVPTHIRSETLASDPQLDALAFSRGRILVSVAGTGDLVLPSWPEIARIVEGCRSPEKPTFPALPQPSHSDAKIN